MKQLDVDVSPPANILSLRQMFTYMTCALPCRVLLVSQDADYRQYRVSQLTPKSSDKAAHLPN